MMQTCEIGPPVDDSGWLGLIIMLGATVFQFGHLNLKKEMRCQRGFFSSPSGSQM
jgi:hypothetical protein